MVLRLEQEDPGFDSSFLPGNKVTGEIFEPVDPKSVGVTVSAPRLKKT